MEVGIVAQRDNARAAELADRIRREVDARFHVDEATADALGVQGTATAALADCDLVVCIGGDGTFLYAAQNVTPTPVMGVNLGEVGFLNATSPHEAVDVVQQEVDRFRTGDADCQELPQVRAEGADGGWRLPPAVNEASVHGPRRGRGNGVGVEVRVDGQLYSGGRADGVIVASPTGSTAYNLSEGGPLVHPSVGAFVVTEMCAEGRMPSLAVPTDATVTVRVEAADHAVVVADGRTRERIEPPATVRFREADEPVRIAGPALEFFAALEKLE